MTGRVELDRGGRKGLLALAAVGLGLIAAWALQLPGRAAAMRLPPQVMALYPYWIDQLAAFLDKAEGDYVFDHWSKDVRFTLALSVPGARSPFCCRAKDQRAS